MAVEAAATSTTKSWLYHPEFPEQWERRPLYSLAQWVNGLVFRDIHFSATGMPVIKIAEIKGGITAQTKFTKQTFGESVLVRRGDLLFSWSGQPETSIDAFWWQGPEGWLNQHVFHVSPSGDVDRIFFYYLLRYLRPNFVGIARNKQTTGLGHVTKRDLENIEAAYPSLPEQRAIAHVLGTLDDNIELNRRMNKTLEAIARAVFKSWFVDFNPVRTKLEGRGARLSAQLAAIFPSRLVQTPDGELPDGWSRAAVESWIDILSGGTPSKNHSEFWGGDIPWISPKVMTTIHADQADESVTAAAIGNGTRVAPSGSVLVMVRGMGLHDHVRVSQARREVAFNQDVKALVPRRIEPSLLLFALLESQEALLTRVESSGHGTGRLPSDVLLAQPLTMPSRKTQAELAKIFDAINDRIEYARAQSRTLVVLRDTLLPKLISGELSVKDAEKFVAL